MVGRCCCAAFWRTGRFALPLGARLGSQTWPQHIQGFNRLRLMLRTPSRSEAGLNAVARWGKAGQRILKGRPRPSPPRDLDRGGERSATPLSHARTGQLFSSVPPARKRCRRCRSATALQKWHHPSQSPGSIRECVPLASVHLLFRAGKIVCAQSNSRP